MAGVGPQDGDRYAVGTQRVTSGDRRVDMEIATYRGLVRTGLVWVEVKAGAIYQVNQLPDYAEQVRDPLYGEPDGRVLTIIPPDAVPEVDTAPGPPRWESKTWSEVALEADRLGREWAGQRRWSRAARQPSAPAQWRYLAELVRRLEQKGYARTEPPHPGGRHRRTARGDVAKNHREPRQGRPRGHQRRDARAQDLQGLKGGCSQTFTPTEPKWFSDREGFGNAYPELLYWNEEDWTPDQRGAPAFCAGITFNEITDTTRYALLDKSWQALLPEGVSAGGTGRLLRVVRTKYLSELIVAGATFDEQVQALKDWASQAITDIMDPDQVPAPTRRLDPAAHLTTHAGRTL
jgi:hypothetical protein